MFGAEDKLRDRIKALEKQLITAIEENHEYMAIIEKENKEMNDMLWKVEGTLNVILRQKEKFSTMYAEPLLTEVEQWRNKKGQ